jgi:hypothetical protein
MLQLLLKADYSLFLVFVVPTGSVQVSLWGPRMLFDIPGQELADEGVCLSSRGSVLVCFSFC